MKRRSPRQMFMTDRFHRKTQLSYENLSKHMYPKRLLVSFHDEINFARFLKLYLDSIHVFQRVL